MCLVPGRLSVLLGLMEVVLAVAVVGGQAARGADGQPQRAFDTALALAVDVSGSVDLNRYHIQMEGIARALEDEAVIKSILSGDNHAILIALVAWSDTSQDTLPWQVIASREDALKVAALIRDLPETTGEFTCVARMMMKVREGLFQSIPGAAAKLVLDVSGDGPDNCSGVRRTEEERDKLVAAGITINGLPIRNENDFIGTGAYRAPGFGWDELQKEPHMAGVTIEDWYRLHVIGGPGAFQVVANGYEDLDKAFRRKFVSEVSADFPKPQRHPRDIGPIPDPIRQAQVFPDFLK